MLGFQLCSTAHAQVGAGAPCTCTLRRQCLVGLQTSVRMSHALACFAAACEAGAALLHGTMFEIKSSLMLRYMAQATTSIQPHAFGKIPLACSGPCPTKVRKSTLMLDMGTLTLTKARQSVCWFICADGVDQAKFRVRRALSYLFVVADADKKSIARQKSMTSTKKQMLRQMQT